MELTPYQKIVQAIKFDSPDKTFDEEMIMEVTLEPVDENYTKITFVFKNIPSGIKPEDNQKGTELTLQKLAHYAERYQ